MDMGKIYVTSWEGIEEDTGKDEGEGGIKERKLK